MATAESCTGGMIAAAMTELAGSSDVFERGFITYSNEAKQEMLGVPAEIIQQYGAVSPQCAEAMATGALQRSRAAIAVSVSGIAGPSGGSKEKPVGLVYIGYALENTPASHIKCEFHGDRAKIRSQATRKALELLIEILVKGQTA